ncbi:MAG: hypothetical protein ACLTMP_07700 [Eggerthella lenta]
MLNNTLMRYGKHQLSERERGAVPRPAGQRRSEHRLVVAAVAQHRGARAQHPAKISQATVGLIRDFWRMS